MIPDKEQLHRWLRSAFEGGPETCRDDFKRCLDALIDTLAELDRVRDELAGCERACRDRGEALERAGLL